MKKILLVFLALCFGCCLNCTFYDGVMTMPYDIKVHHNIIIYEEKGVELDLSIKKMIFEELDRFPQAHGAVKKIKIVPYSDELDYAGQYFSDQKLIVLVENPLYKMKRTLWHELGHALHTTLTSSQNEAWKACYLNRLYLSGIGKPTGDTWREVPQYLIYANFPTNYSTKSFKEYIAEHVELYVTNKERHKLFFEEEYNLIIRCFNISGI